MEGVIVERRGGFANRHDCRDNVKRHNRREQNRTKADLGHRCAAARGTGAPKALPAPLLPTRTAVEQVGSPTPAYPTDVPCAPPAPPSGPHCSFLEGANTEASLFLHPVAEGLTVVAPCVDDDGDDIKQVMQARKRRVRVPRCGATLRANISGDEPSHRGRGDAPRKLYWL